jgi:vancomycin aglycone glucosyltransferase
MRIVLAAEGTRGDVHPFLALAELLAARGADVLVCAPPDFEAEARERGLPYRNVGPPVRAFLEQQAAAVHGTTSEVLRVGRDFIAANLPLQMAAMVDAVRGAELVLAASTQAAAVTAAELHGARHRFVAYAPGIIPSPDVAPIMMPWPRLRGLPARAAWWVTQRLANALLRGPIDRERAKLGLPPVRDVMEHMIGAEPLLAADEELAPAPRGARVRVESIGCLHPFDADAPLPEKLEAFLAAGEPPVYVGFGSMTDPAPSATTRLVLDAVARAGVRAILSRGWAGLGDGPLPGDVIEIGPVSHAALFRRVAAVVHHGGAGTTTMAARAGTPQVVVPHLLDQHYWGARVVDLGLGPPPLPRRRLSADALAGALASLRDNDLVADRAAELGERLRERLRTRDVARIVLGDGVN